MWRRISDHEPRADPISKYGNVLNPNAIFLQIFPHFRVPQRLHSKTGFEQVTFNEAGGVKSSRWEKRAVYCILGRWPSLRYSSQNQERAQLLAQGDGIWTASGRSSQDTDKMQGRESRGKRSQ